MDNFTKDGADAIALGIVRYWHERGHNTVQAWSYHMTEGNWGVRSNLVGGMPPSTLSALQISREALRIRRMAFLG